MNKLAFIIALLFAIPIIAQENLLINGDFEEYVACPENETYHLEPPPLEIEQCIGWKSPTYGTSDYLNSCSSNWGVSTPVNFLGYQKPLTGNGYLGALFYSNTGGTGLDGYTGSMWWEYVQGVFKTELIKDNIYNIVFYISIGDGSDYAIKEFGAYISKEPISSINTANLTVIPQLVFTNETYFKDTSSWIKIEGLYRADGGEKYITIGNFKSNIETDTINIQKLEIQSFISYFYIDGAKIYDVSIEQPISNVFSPNNDGVNDYWHLPNLPGYKVTIYNRWGNHIINSELIDFKWNGKNNNDVLCSEGTYFYVISKENSTVNSIKGFIQLFH